jgi:hypothetical protein
MRNKAYLKGVEDALSLVAEYDLWSLHNRRVSDCVRWKLNVPGARRPRKTPPLSCHARKWLLAELQRERSR